ncbi:MAG: hypothetical protein EAZ55_13330 [Cytophagales bacterium]|nr:MAG: hypothetical protein EAZ55_13330 [Cytophagales bacterium]
MRFEKEFKKDVPDQDVGNISTVGDMANWFYNNLTIYQPDKKVEEIIFNSLKKAFLKLNLQSNFNYENTLGDFIPKNDLLNIWKELEQQLNLKIPELNPQDLADKELKEIKIFGLTISKPKPRILDTNFRRFVECIGALNYEKFVDFDNLTSLFEITIAIIGLTQEKCGMDIDEIFVDSSFVNDLGID